MSATPKSQLGQLEPGRTGTARSPSARSTRRPTWAAGARPCSARPCWSLSWRRPPSIASRQLLTDGQESLGVKVEIEHIAPTPVGLEVTATAELIGIDGRTLHFKVEARDARELIGRGRHTRIVVDAARFRAKAQAKLAKLEPSYRPSCNKQVPAPSADHTGRENRLSRGQTSCARPANLRTMTENQAISLRSRPLGGHQCAQF